MAQKKINPRFPFNFLPKDVRLIRKAVEPYFLGTISMTLSAHRQFLPDCPTLFRHIRSPLKNNFKINVAEGYIDYLGFDSEFKKALLDFYRENLILDKDQLADRGRTPRSRALRRLANMFLDLRGERLRQILVVDSESKERWERNLGKGFTWADVRILASTAAKVVGPLFRKYYKKHYNEKTLEREFRRYLDDSP